MNIANEAGTTIGEKKYQLLLLMLTLLIFSGPFLTGL